MKTFPSAVYNDICMVAVLKIWRQKGQSKFLVLPWYALRCASTSAKNGDL